MPLQNIERTDPINQTSWDSGMITTLPPEELPEDAAVLIENFDFDGIGNLKSRVPAVQFVETDTIQGNLCSIFPAHYSNGNFFYYFSSGTSIYRMAADGTGQTAIATVTIETFVNWLMFDDFAIAINTVPGANVPIKVDSAGADTILNANAPDCVHGVVWNSRLWLAGEGSNGNTIYGSAINDPEDWTSTGDAGAIELGININDGDFIVALAVFRGNLVVYKSSSIYMVSAISAPATIPSNLRVDLYTDKVGCVAARSIQNVLDDQVFVSILGIVSLSLLSLGEVKTAILSRNIVELSTMRSRTLMQSALNSPIFALLFVQKQQYALFLPGTIENSGNHTVWIMDYSDIMEKGADGLPKIRFCKFTGTDIVGLCGCIASYETAGFTSESYLIGRFAPSPAADNAFFRYSPNEPSLSWTGTVSKRLLTRAFGNSTLRSLFHRFCVTLNKLTTNVSLSAGYYYDLFTTTLAGSYTHSLTGTPSNNSRTIWRQFKKNDSSRKANLVQLNITANTADQGLTIKSVALTRTELNYKHANTKWVSD